MYIRVEWGTDGQDVELPNEVDIPESIVNKVAETPSDIDEIITGWLSDEFGYLVRSYSVIDK